MTLSCGRPQRCRRWRGFLQQGSLRGELRSVPRAVASGDTKIRNAFFRIEVNVAVILSLTTYAFGRAPENRCAKIVRSPPSIAVSSTLLPANIIDELSLSLYPQSRIDRCGAT